MMRVAIVYHSKHGHTKTLAEHVANGTASVDGVQADMMSITGTIDWELLATCEAIIFGCPTYLGNVTGEFKLHFMDAIGDVYLKQKWKNKIAAGFTNSHSASGDKLGTLIQMAIFAAQNGMIWVGQADKRSGSTIDDINRLGSYLGVMAQSDPCLGTILPPEGDRKTAYNLGKRVAEIAVKLQA